MNKKLFNKKVCFEIENNTLSSFTLQNMIDNENKCLFNNESIIKLIEENFNDIISNCVDKYATIKLLYRYRELRKVINENLGWIIFLCNDYEINCIIASDSFNFNTNEYINNHFEKFLNGDKERIYNLYFIDKILDLSELNIIKLNEDINNNMKILVESFLPYHFRYSCCNNTDYNSLLEVISMLIREMCEVEKIKYTDIEFGKSGAFANTIIIGSKVLKIGEKRKTYKIPNDKRILKPLIRVNLEDYSEIEGVIEVSNKVDTNINLSDEELYDLYRELRERKIIFTDLKNDNLGYLLKDNNYNWEKSLSNIAKARGLLFEESIMLKKGDIVILDTDYIYKDDSPNVVYASGRTKKFEQIYQNEVMVLKK